MEGEGVECLMSIWDREGMLQAVSPPHPTPFADPPPLPPKTQENVRVYFSTHFFPEPSLVPTRYHPSFLVLNAPASPTSDRVEPRSISKRLFFENVFFLGVRSITKANPREKPYPTSRYQKDPTLLVPPLSLVMGRNDTKNNIKTFFFTTT